MRRRGLIGLFGIALAACATVPASGRVPPAHGVTSSCMRRTSPVRSGRPADPDALTPEQLRAMLRDFAVTLRARYGVADERALEASRKVADRLVVPLRFHVLTDGRNGRLPRSTVDQQVRTLNAAYGGRLGGADTGVTFRLDSVDVTKNPQW